MINMADKLGIRLSSMVEIVKEHFAAQELKSEDLVFLYKEQEEFRIANEYAG